MSRGPAKMLFWVPAVTLATGAQLWGAGCSLDGDCDATPIPVLGSPAEYRFKAGSYQGVTVRDPVPCADRSLFLDGYFIAVEGTGARRWHFRMIGDGACPVPPDGGGREAGPTGCPVANLEAFLLDLQTTLVMSGVKQLGQGFGDACKARVVSPGAYAYFWIRDWRIADQVVATVVSHTGQWGLGENVGVLVSGQVPLCPLGT